MHRFHEHGYAATRIKEIVAATRYTDGAFYFHFRNKADCFWQVIAHRERHRGGFPVHVLDGLDPATASLEEVLHRVFAHFAATDDSVSSWVLVMVDFFQQHRDDPDAQARLVDTYRGWHEGLVRFVTALQRGGWVGAERDPELLATQIFAYTEGTSVHANLYRLDRTGLVDGLVRLLRD